MSWQLYLKSAECVLESDRIPSSQELISLIKRINPTSLPLPDSAREHGYRIKNRLQSLLLENYGEAFHLVPHPFNRDIILIKHNALPSVDACHADLNALSMKALDTVGDLVSAPAEAPARIEAKARSRKPSGGCSPKEALRNAELLLAQYEYPRAEEILASLRITSAKDLPILVKAARMLVEEVGAFERAIELLLKQPLQLLKDKTVRELLALTYYGNGMVPEARALFDAEHPADLGKNALYAYADISFKDGNLSKAYQLIKLSEEREGFVTAHASLRKEIEDAMLREATPFLQEAEAAIVQGNPPLAESLLQKALSLYPNFQKARQLAGELEAGKAGAELKSIRARLQSAEAAAERLDLLAKLLERDKENEEEIRELMVQERCRQKKEILEDRHRTLRTLAAQKRWEECFDLLLWLSRQGDEAQYLLACRISPCFSVLYQNRRMRRLSDEGAKELWLSLLRLKGLVEQGEAENCWELAQSLKPYFTSYPFFKEEYDKVLEAEQKKAADEVHRSLARLEDLCGLEDPGDALAEARRLVAHIRREIGVLPADHGAIYKNAAQRMLHCLEPETDEPGILDYREALILGNSFKAAQLKESSDFPWMEVHLKEIEGEVAEILAISAEPVPLTISPGLVVDLAAESALHHLEYMCASQSHLLFREDDETIIVVNVSRMNATRYRSPNFKDLEVSDVLPDQDLFLFAATSNNNTMWRAVLSDSESRFTARYQINEHFYYQEKASFGGLFMSCSKDNVYYAVIQEGDTIRVVKQTVDLVSTILHTFEIKGAFKDAFRLSNRPDRFVIVTEDSTTVLESNLSPPKGYSRLGASQTLDCFGVDPSESRMYVHGDALVNVLNQKLIAVKQYKGTEAIDYMTFMSFADVCVEKDTILANINGLGIFYNMQTNRFSQKFSLTRLLHTGTPSRWYYWEFDEAKPEVKIKDITDEVETLLEWKVLLSAGDDEETVAKFVEILENPASFSIVEPAASEPVGA